MKLQDFGIYMTHENQAKNNKYYLISADNLYAKCHHVKNIPIFQIENCFCK